MDMGMDVNEFLREILPGPQAPESGNAPALWRKCRQTSYRVDELFGKKPVKAASLRRPPGFSIRNLGDRAHFRKRSYSAPPKSPDPPNTPDLGGGFDFAREWWRMPKTA